jgi:GNAT superfamily N-acetyltransferase
MFETVPLNSSHKRISFTCEESTLTDYLKKQAGQDVKRKVAACFVHEDAGGIVKGYYTLSADSIDRSILPDKLGTKLPYKDLPVILLGRLARDGKFKGQGIGELLLADALRRAWQTSSAIGAWAVVTDPINAKAAEFYERFGFIRLESGRMFVPMATIKASMD